MSIIAILSVSFRPSLWYTPRPHMNFGPLRLWWRFIIKMWKEENIWKEILRNITILFFVFFNLLPLIFTFIFWKIDSFGKNELCCWVKAQNRGSQKEIIIQIIIFILRWLNIILCITYSVKIICFFASVPVNSEEEKKRRKLVFRILLFPLLQILG